MKLLGSVTGLLVVMLVISCAAAMVIGQGRDVEASDAIKGRLGLCNNAPCFMGIQPGKTMWEDVHQLVAALPDDEVIRNDDKEIHIIFGDGTHVTMTRKASRKVEAIWLNSYASQRISRMLPLSMASLVTQLGVPCSVQANESFVQVMYPGVYGVLQKQEDRLEPGMAVYTMTLIDTTATTYPCPSQRTGRSWRGFISLAGYMPVGDD